MFTPTQPRTDQPVPRSSAQITQLGAAWTASRQREARTQSGGSARGYREIVGPLTDRQAQICHSAHQAVCLCIAALGANLLICRISGGLGNAQSAWWHGAVVGGSERLCGPGCEPGEAGDDAGALEQPAEVDEPVRLYRTSQPRPVPPQHRILARRRRSDPARPRRLPAAPTPLRRRPDRHLPPGTSV